MHRLLRDFLVAVAGGVVVALVVTFATSLSELQLVLVYCGILIVCGLIAAGLTLPGYAKRRLEQYRTELVATVKAAVIAELAQQEPAVKEAPPMTLVAAQAAAYAEEIVDLRVVLSEGRTLQARLSNWVSETRLPDNFIINIREWEGKALTALVGFPNRLTEFKDAPERRFRQSYEADARMEHELEAIEHAIQDLNDKPESRTIRGTSIGQ